MKQLLRFKLSGKARIPFQIYDEREPTCGGGGQSIALGSLEIHIALLMAIFFAPR